MARVLPTSARAASATARVTTAGTARSSGGRPARSRSPSCELSTSTSSPPTDVPSALTDATSTLNGGVVMLGSTSSTGVRAPTPSRVSG